MDADFFRYNESERAWLFEDVTLPACPVEFIVEGDESAISEAHLAVAKRIAADLPAVVALAVGRIRSWLKGLDNTPFELDTVIVRDFPDSGTYDEKIVSFLLSFTPGSRYDDLGDDIGYASYAVRFTEEFHPIAAEMWFS